ncbi:MAG: acyltransferase [Pseudomonadota bacterium]
MSTVRAHSPLIDAIKAIAAQLIVLHHLAWYGPMSDISADWFPLLGHWQDWLAEYGRYAVAAFLAVGGFLAAQTLPPGGLPAGKSPLCLIGQRYARLVGPYAVALVIVMVSAALARHWMTHDSIGAAPTLGQFVAHLFLLYDLLDYEALSAGVWYVAIDFQLYVVLVGLLWLAGQLGCRLASADFLGPLLVTLVGLGSLFHFNRDAAWDSNALYFFGAYALGVGSAWAARSAQPLRFLLLVGLVGTGALLIEFRERILIALIIAMVLGMAQQRPLPSGRNVLAHLGQTSYALFLIHFPVCLIVNAAFQRFLPHTPGWSTVGVLVAWLASNLVALLFYRFVEAKIGARLAAWFSCRTGRPARPAY